MKFHLGVQLDIRYEVDVRPEMGLFLAHNFSATPIHFWKYNFGKYNFSATPVHFGKYNFWATPIHFWKYHFLKYNFSAAPEFTFENIFASSCTSLSVTDKRGEMLLMLLM